MTLEALIDLLRSKGVTMYEGPLDHDVERHESHDPTVKLALGPLPAAAVPAPRQRERAKSVDEKLFRALRIGEEKTE